MFILTSVRWLRNTRIHSAPPATVSSILEKMITAADAIWCRSRRDTHRCKDAEDEAWIRQLWHQDGPLLASYGQLFRRLVHIFEMSYRRDVLVGDQNWIRWRLHSCLKRAHREGTCEVEGCPWLAHTCDGTDESYYKECPLLAKGEGNVTGPSSGVPSPQQVSNPEVDFAQAPDIAASHEQPPESTPLRSMDVVSIEPSSIPGSTEDRDVSSSQPMASGDAHDASAPIHSLGTASDTSAAAFHASQSTASHLSPVIDVAPRAFPVDSVAVPISPSPGRSSAADEVSPSDSHGTESPSRDVGESHMKEQDASCRDVIDPGAGVDAELSAADAPLVQQHETVPLAAAATEAVSAGNPSAAHGTSDKIDAPDAAVSHPTTPAPLSMPSVPPPTSTVDSQPPASLGGPLLDPAGSSSAEIRSPAVTTVSRGHPHAIARKTHLPRVSPPAPRSCEQDMAWMPSGSERRALVALRQGCSKGSGRLVDGARGSLS